MIILQDRIDMYLNNFVHRGFGNVVPRFSPSYPLSLAPQGRVGENPGKHVEDFGHRSDEGVGTVILIINKSAYTVLDTNSETRCTRSASVFLNQTMSHSRQIITLSKKKNQRKKFQKVNSLVLSIESSRIFKLMQVGRC